ncbi:uncharacterized protein SPPG_04646 [Spizellomyces punctatus DAOM BR117]|uniref:RGS domain-containing protein n=1 Tax=Spizellomyces punctatus (strain DAOM BR117) TaxID=645134 RepID=A0A0L0HGW8_SPIPD|nr:uncharacterized protein SPPG_04646 [Spizellomyces punctatus DAOM BR117]KND00322.1 hypothetical protein SPPG_04646 [Spizellomyces punctatus DAOM BR117]|eukprot:XP_016608361.1 hypothetical protein SPPG_04646 [Spizellomyces punctatus DAOM BR117]
MSLYPSCTSPAFTTTAPNLPPHMDARSKRKCSEFFGEDVLPFNMGKGSSRKLWAYLAGVGVTGNKRASWPTAGLPTEEVVEVPRSSTPVQHSASVTWSPLVRSSTRKLADIMGESCPLDVCVRDIEEGGLEVMLESRLPLIYFLSHLLAEHTAESLFFTHDMKSFAQSSFPTTASLLHHSQDLFSTYLDAASVLEINVSQSTRRIVATNIRHRKGIAAFDHAVVQVKKLLEQAWTRFKESRTWSTMKADLGHSRIITNESEYKAKATLYSVLAKQYNPATVGEDPARVLLVRKKTKEVVASLGIELGMAL